MKSTRKIGFTSHLKGSVLAGVVLGAISGTTASAQELRYAVGMPESSYNYDNAVFFSEELARTSDVDVKVYALSLLGLNEIPGGIRDGLADFGFSLFPYFPAEFSELNLPASLSWLASTGSEAKWPGPAMLGASMEYVMLNCPDCLEQLDRFNTVFLSGGVAVDYGLVCNKPVESIKDIVGKKVRTGAADVSRFVEYFGGTQVSLSGNEIYDALNTGNVDCSTVPPETLTGLRLMEVADFYSHLLPGNMFSGIGIANMNRDTWNGLTEEQRRAVLNAAAKTSASSWVTVKNLNASSLKTFKDAGKIVFDTSAEDRAKIGEFAKQDTEVVRNQFVDQYGIEGVDEKIALITDLIEKWKGLTNQIDEMDVDAFASLYIDEVHSKIDVSSYGID